MASAFKEHDTQYWTFGRVEEYLSDYQPTVVFLKSFFDWNKADLAAALSFVSSRLEDGGPQPGLQDLNKSHELRCNIEEAMVDEASDIFLNRHGDTTPPWFEITLMRSPPGRLNKRCVFQHFIQYCHACLKAKAKTKAAEVEAEEIRQAPNAMKTESTAADARATRTERGRVKRSRSKITAIEADRAHMMTSKLDDGEQTSETPTNMTKSNVTDSKEQELSALSRPAHEVVLQTPGMPVVPVPQVGSRHSSNASSMNLRKPLYKHRYIEPTSAFDDSWSSTRSVSQHLQTSPSSSLMNAITATRKRSASVLSVDSDIEHFRTPFMWSPQGMLPLDKSSRSFQQLRTHADTLSSDRFLDLSTPTRSLAETYIYIVKVEETTGCTIKLDRQHRSQLGQFLFTNISTGIQMVDYTRLTDWAIGAAADESLDLFQISGFGKPKACKLIDGYGVDMAVRQLHEQLVQSGKSDTIQLFAAEDYRLVEVLPEAELRESCNDLSRCVLDEPLIWKYRSRIGVPRHDAVPKVRRRRWVALARTFGIIVQGLGSSVRRCLCPVDIQVVSFLGCLIPDENFSGFVMNEWKP